MRPKFSLLRVAQTVLTVCTLVTASALAASTPAVAGSYAIVSETAAGAQTRIQMRIHLVNRGISNLAVERMTFWDFSHPATGATQACKLALRAHGSAVTTQQFLIPRAEYELWQKGAHPRLVLEVAGPDGTQGRLKSKAVLRLTREFKAEAK